MPFGRAKCWWVIEGKEYKMNWMNTSHIYVWGKSCKYQFVRVELCVHITSLLLLISIIISLLISLLMYDLQSKDWINTYYIVKLSKGMKATQSVKWNEMYKWKDDMKHPGYGPELIYAQG